MLPSWNVTPCDPACGWHDKGRGSPNLKVLPLHQFWGDGKEERILFLPLSSFPPEAKHRARSGACGQPASLVPIVGRGRKARITCGERVKNSNVQRGCQILIPLVQLIGMTSEANPLQYNKHLCCVYFFMKEHLAKRATPIACLLHLVFLIFISIFCLTSPPSTTRDFCSDIITVTGVSASLKSMRETTNKQ